MYNLYTSIKVFQNVFFEVRSYKKIFDREVTVTSGLTLVSQCWVKLGSSRLINIFQPLFETIFLLLSNLNIPITYVHSYLCKVKSSMPRKDGNLTVSTLNHGKLHWLFKGINRVNKHRMIFLVGSDYQFFWKYFSIWSFLRI